MPFSIDFLDDGRVLEWEATADGVVVAETVARRPGFRRDEETVLAVDVAHIDRVTPLARQARQLSKYPIGDLACLNVDFSREFRYCLETGVDPTPASELSTLRLSVPVTETSNDVYRREQREYHGPPCPWVKRVKPPNLTISKPY